MTYGLPGHCNVHSSEAKHNKIHLSALYQCSGTWQMKNHVQPLGTGHNITWCRSHGLPCVSNTTVTPSTVVGLARLGPMWPLAEEDNGPLATPAVALLPLLLLMPLLLESCWSSWGIGLLNPLVSSAMPTNHKWMHMNDVDQV